MTAPCSLAEAVTFRDKFGLKFTNKSLITGDLNPVAIDDKGHLYLVASSGIVNQKTPISSGCLASVIQGIKRIIAVVVDFFKSLRCNTNSNISIQEGRILTMATNFYNELIAYEKIELLENEKEKLSLEAEKATYEVIRGAALAVWKDMDTKVKTPSMIQYDMGLRAKLESLLAEKSELK